MPEQEDVAKLSAKLQEQPDEVEVVQVAGEEVLPLPLDRGYAWVVTFSCMMNSFIVDGIANSFGVMLADFCEYFRAEKSAVTLIGSLLCGVYLLVGPMVGPLVNKFGCRPVCMVGSVVSALAFIASSFAPNLASLTLAYGVLGGVGFGLVYLPSMVCVNFYFEKYRPLAMGLAVCGTGVGTVVMGPVTKALLESMGWQNTMMVLAGVVLNSAVFGALMRPNEPRTSVEEKTQPRRRHRISIGDGARPRSVSHDVGEVGKIDALAEEYVRRGRGESDIVVEAAKARADSERKVFASAGSGLEVRSDGCLTNSEAILRSLPSMVAERRASQGKYKRAGRSVTARHFDVETMRKGVTAATLNDLKRPLYRKDIFYSGSVMHLGGMHIRKSQPGLSRSLLMLSMTRIPGEPSLDGQSARWSVHRQNGCCRFLPKPIVDAFMLMMNLSIMRNPSFVILWFGNLVAMLAFNVPLFFVNDYSREIGVSDVHAKYLNSAFGAANTLSRILVGMLAGHPRVSPILINNLSLLLSGVLTVALNVCSEFFSLVCVYALLGVTLAPIITLTSEILCSLVGLDNLTNAFGFIILARGISTCIGPPLTASLYNDRLKYVLPFVVGGALFLGSAVIFSVLFLPAFRRQRARTKSEVEHAIRSVQNLSASLMLLEGRQVLASSVDLGPTSKLLSTQAETEEESRERSGYFEETV